MPPACSLQILPKPGRRAAVAPQGTGLLMECGSKVPAFELPAGVIR